MSCGRAVRMLFWEISVAKTDMMQHGRKYTPFGNRVSNPYPRREVYTGCVKSGGFARVVFITMKFMKDTKNNHWRP